VAAREQLLRQALVQLEALDARGGEDHVAHGDRLFIGNRRCRLDRQ
jgi:hypothetical protein